MQRLAIITCILLAASRVHAQSNDSTALAEQLFNQGRELAHANHWAAACPKFEASYRYDPTLGTRLNLATCYEKLHKLASAWAHYRGAAELAGKMGDTERRDYALKHAAALEPRLPKLTITAPASLPDRFAVTRDNITLDTAALGGPLYVDPGVHEIRATAPGAPPFVISVQIEESQSQTVTIPDLAAYATSGPAGARAAGARALVPAPTPSAAQVPPLARAPDPPPPPSRPPAAAPPLSPPPPRILAPPAQVSVPPASSAHTPRLPPQPGAPSATAPSELGRRKLAAIGLGAAGGVAVGVGVGFGLKARSTNNEVRALCGPDLACDDPDYDRGHRMVNDARSQATISTVLVAGGAAAVLGGAILWFTAPAERAAQTARVVPRVDGRGEVGLSIAGRF
jgi:hypothetical protein